MVKKIKVLRIIARLNIGGPAINAVILTAGLNNDGFESLLVTGSINKGEGDMSYLAVGKNITPIVMPYLRRKINPINDLIAFLKLYRLLGRFGPDIVHTHTAKAGTIGRLSVIIFNLLHRKKIIVVHTFHGHVLSGYFSGFLTRLFVVIERILAFFSDRIIAVSESVKKDLLALGIGDEAKIKVVCLGFELEKFLSIPMLQNNIDLTIGIVARLVPIKNHKMFLDAAKLLLTERRTSNTDPRFFIIGDGELRQELEEYARSLGIIDAIRFTGWKKDLVEVYNRLDIVALTSLNEGTPVSLIEALASGRAAIATDVGGVRDIIGSRVYPEIADRGILVKAGDLEGFTGGLKLLLGDVALRKRLGTCGREFTRQFYSSKRLIGDMDLVYREVLI